MALEEPEFKLLLKHEDFELRDYAARVVAEVAVTGDLQVAVNKGFRLLAGYIFGGNAKSRKIAMTAPVTSLPTSEYITTTAPVMQSEGQAGDWLVRFIMPRCYALVDLPVPDDLRVQLKELPAARFAVLSFSGLTGLARVAGKTARLLAVAKSREMAPEGPVSLARYDPPWTPWFKRRNEVMFLVGAR